MFELVSSPALEILGLDKEQQAQYVAESLVAGGATVLTILRTFEDQPWQDALLAAKIDMQSDTQDVLGSLYGTRENGIRVLNLQKVGDNVLQKLGFVLSSDTTNEALSTAWSERSRCRYR